MSNHALRPRGGFPPIQVPPIPTASCDIADGSPGSYLYDPFDDNRGWWSLGTAEITGGLLKPIAINGSSTASLLLTSKTPDIGESVTAIINASYNAGPTVGRGASLFYGGYYSLIAYSTTADPPNPGMYYWATANGSVDPTSYVYREFLNLPPGNYLSEMKMVFTSAAIQFYLNGVLKHTQAVAVNLSTPPQIRVSNQAVDNTKRYVSDFWLFGYNLPVDC